MTTHAVVSKSQPWLPSVHETLVGAVTGVVVCGRIDRQDGARVGMATDGTIRHRVVSESSGSNPLRHWHDESPLSPTHSVVSRSHASHAVSPAASSLVGAASTPCKAPTSSKAQSMSKGCGPKSAIAAAAQERPNAHAHMSSPRTKDSWMVASVMNSIASFNFFFFLERFFTLAAQRMHSPKREHGMCSHSPRKGERPRSSCLAAAVVIVAPVAATRVGPA
jgi:hypothetical protein